jgi:retron-type reverse transcriptase
VVQAAAKLILEPIFEVDFEDSSHGFRPGRGATGALEVLRKTAHNKVFDADIRDFFVVWRRQCAHLGVLVRYADDFVVMCRTAKECQEAERRVRIILERLKLALHPDKTRRVDLSWCEEGFDFLGCHLRKRLSGPIWEKERRRVYFLQRWPSQRSAETSQPVPSSLHDGPSTP